MSRKDLEIDSTEKEPDEPEWKTKIRLVKGKLYTKILEWAINVLKSLYSLN